MKRSKSKIGFIAVGVLMALLFVQGQYTENGFTKSTSNADGEPWGSLFGPDSGIQFSNRFSPDQGSKKYTAPPRPVPIDAGLAAIQSDSVYASRLNELYAYDSFEGAVRSIWTREMAGDDYSGVLSTDYAFDGTTSLRVELRKDDPVIQGSKRSELALRFHEDRLEEHTYSVAILLPNGGTEDYALDPNGSEVILQWHNVPDDGEEWTTPPLALRTYNGRYILERCWDDAEYSTNESMTEKKFRATYDLGSYIGDKGRFVHWSFKIKWGWLDSHAPKIEVFKDGAKILVIDGPNTTNDENGVVMKLGVYKWDWNQRRNRSILDKRVIYYDRILIE